MATILSDLGSEVFLFVAAFKRKARRGAAIAGPELHADAVRLFRDLDQGVQREAAASAMWESARKALVYLVDEVMSVTEWEYRGWWSNNTLEAAVLGSPQKMRGVAFFDELERVKRHQAQVRPGRSPEDPYVVDVLSIFYCCLRFGFEGKFIGQPQELQREAREVYELLPTARDASERVYFPEAYHHTVEVPPDYQAVMRLATLAAIMVGGVVVFLGGRALLHRELIEELRAAALVAGDYFRG